MKRNTAHQRGRAAERPALSTGNRIYLYGIIKDAVGSGRQVLLPHVEEALEAAGLGAAAMGFEDARSVLEAMGDAVELTVFKGGRVYATLVPQPAWDRALEEPQRKPAAKGGAKSWKRKRSDKSLKPVRPRTVRAAAAEGPGEPEATAPEDAAAGRMAQAAGEAPADAGRPSPAAEAAEAPVPSDATALPEPGEGGERPVPDDGREPGEASPEAEPPEGAAEESDAAPAPAISLTVTYDPDDELAGTTTLESTPAPAPPAGDGRVAPAAAEGPDGDAAAPAPEPAGAVAPAAEAAEAPGATAPAAPAPDDPDVYPQDFPADVYCPGKILNELCHLFPLGADVMGLAGEYLYIAALKGTAEVGRSRIAFPVSYPGGGARKTARVTIRRRGSAASGPLWSVEKVEPEDE